MSRRIYIIGDSNSVTSDATGVVLINCDGQTITSDDNGSVIINNGAMTIDSDGVSTAVPAPKFITLSGGSSNTAGTDEAIYYCDATAGNISITVVHTTIPKTFVRIDGSANTVTITPASGLINGAANYGLNTQYEKITVLSYSGNLYY